MFTRTCNKVSLSLHVSLPIYRLYGFDPEKGPPTWEERLRRVHPDDRAKWQGVIERAIAGASDYELEFRILLSDGTVKLDRKSTRLYSSKRYISYSVL